jgi:hypothetical protein
MSFEVHAVASSGASTIDGSVDSEFDECRASQSRACLKAFTEGEYFGPAITSLEMLDIVLFKILSDQDNPNRLSNAKEAIEAYRGVDWRYHQRFPTQSVENPNGYERVLLKRHEGLYDILILSWSEVKSPIHDHPCERCFLMPLCGSMTEERFEKAGDGNLKLVNSVPIPNGVASWIDDTIGYHRVGNSGTGIACSLHCYIPGFSRPCTIFDPETSCEDDVFRVRERAATWCVADK